MGWHARVWLKSAVGASKAAGVDRVIDHSVKPRAAQWLNSLSFCGKGGGAIAQLVEFGTEPGRCGFK
jgi:hypothetical protein